MTLVDLRSIVLRRVGIILHSDDGASAFLLLSPNYVRCPEPLPDSSSDGRPKREQ
jgi:hypothetical protein